jgi:hypothetical protein
MRQLLVLHFSQFFVLAVSSIAAYTLRDLHNWLSSH